MVPDTFASRADSCLQRRRCATVRIFNETPWPILVVPHGGRSTAGVVIAHGEEATLSLPLAGDRSLAVRCHGHHRLYTLDFDLLGFDTVHVRTADLVPVEAL